MKHQFWSFVLRLVLLFTGIFLCKSSIFVYKENNGEVEGTLLMLIGIIFLVISIIITLPVIINHPERIERLENFSRYLIQAPLWCFVSLLLVELTLRAMMRNPPLRRDVTNWAGDIPSVHAMILWGKEGYAITRYEKWGEIRTPYHDSNKNNDVIILGDSQTEGLQVADDQKFTSVAETIVRLDGYDFDLHNLGRSGLAMADYISWIPAYQSLYRPKVIVIQLTESDFIDSFHLGQFNYFIARDNKIIELFQTYDLSDGFVQQARRTYYWSGLQMQELGHERWDAMQPTAKDLAIESTSEDTRLEVFIPELAEQQMEILMDVSDGTPIIVVLLPSTPYIFGDGIQLMDPAHEKLKEFIKRYPEIKIVDPLPEFQELLSAGYLPRGFLNTSPGVGHLNKYGNEVVGRLLAKAIEQVLK